MTPVLTRRLPAAGTGLGCVALVMLAGLLLRDTTPPADAWILDRWYAAPGSTAAAAATAVSGLGTMLAVGAVVVGAVLVWRRQRAGGLLLRSLAVTVACASVLVLQRLISRPGPPQQPEAGTYPSGHVTIITALVVAAVLLFGALGPHWRRAALIGGSVAIVLVAVSRMVLAEHWLVDTVAAVVATAGVGLVAAALLRLDGRAGTTARR